MIIRVVRMHFEQESVEQFLSLFQERRDKIRHFAGCSHLELWQDTNNPSVYYTYSHWENEDALNHYRFSEFFKDTWSKTKTLFKEKAQAWSTIRVLEA